ncbi:MAG: hypothetical protein HY301_00840, partial [Verrucomicrobia bacterium]|nr:hypothetical protein [Verrucomicrobiota bacterium]
MPMPDVSPVTPDKCERFRTRVRPTVVVAGMLCVLLFGVARAGAQSLSDNFTNRPVYTNATGNLSATNTNATIEPLEPLHAGKPGGHSMWISWVAPTNGVVKFSMETSTFDTLLAAYRFNSTNDTTLDLLIPVVGSDDSIDFGQESEIEFGVVAGRHYEIAVDGYYGAN